MTWLESSPSTYTRLQKYSETQEASVRDETWTDPPGGYPSVLQVNGDLKTNSEDDSLQGFVTNATLLNCST